MAKKQLYENVPYSPELGSHICRWLSEGYTLTEIYNRKGKSIEYPQKGLRGVAVDVDLSFDSGPMPNPALVTAWRKKHKEFDAMYKEAKKVSGAAKADKIEIANKEFMIGVELGNIPAKDIQSHAIALKESGNALARAAKWDNPEEYGDKLQMDVTHGITINIVGRGEPLSLEEKKQKAIAAGLVIDGKFEEKE